MQSGTDDEKTALVNKRGVEIATFIDRFTVRNGILPISADGKTGGFSIVGWSLGSGFALSAIANIHALSLEAQARFATHLRAVILQGMPPSCVFVYDLTGPPPQIQPRLLWVYPTSKKFGRPSSTRVYFQKNEARCSTTGSRATSNTATSRNETRPCSNT